MIKTINLNGYEIKVTELGGDNTEIINNGSGIVYASKLPNIKVGGDEVIAIPAGAIDGLYGTHGTVYLLGTGSVELRGVDHKITESRSQSVDGGVGLVQDYIDSRDAEILGNAKEYADSLNAEIAGFIGYTDNDIYGLEADFENCVFTRLAGAVGKNAGADFDCVNAYGGRRRCNLSDSGEVLAYYGDENFKTDGSNGQVMVEQPKFYYRVVPLKTEKIDGTDGYHLRKARYYISDTPKAGFKVHPAFVRDGVEVDRIYLSAFEGCIYDTSAGVYLLEDEQIADFDNDILSSIAGARPCSGSIQALTRANARTLAHNRGKGWEQETIHTISATKLLFIIEYGCFNSQSLLAAGLSNVEKIYTGSTLSLGSTTGTIEIANGEHNISYRGEENVWGNTIRFVDGINILNPQDFEETHHCGKNFISNNNFSDNVFQDHYIDTKIPSVYCFGYMSFFGYSQDCDWAFIPTMVTGNTHLPVGDRFLNRRGGNKVAIMFGNGKDEGGLFFVNFGLSSDYHAVNLNARLTFFPYE